MAIFVSETRRYRNHHLAMLDKNFEDFQREAGHFFGAGTIIAERAEIAEIAEIEIADTILEISFGQNEIVKKKEIKFASSGRIWAPRNFAKREGLFDEGSSGK